ncbi:MAG: hypothetical protein V3R96_00260, partial [Dehalococcoidales bacterium]
VSIISISLIFGASPALAQTEERNEKEVAVSGEEGSDNQTAPRVITVNTGLMEEYERLVKMLGEAERKGDEELTKTILEKIRVIKGEIEKATRESGIPQLAVEKPVKLVPIEVTAVSPIRLDECAELKTWESKKQHYEALYALSDDELKDKGYREGKEEIRKIIAELDEGIKRLRTKCEAGVTTGTGSGALTLTPEQRVYSPGDAHYVAVTRPIAVESGVEITDYFSRRIAEITTKEVEVNKQIVILKELRNEIDRLIEELIKSKDKINTREVSGLVTKIEVRPGEIRMDQAVVKTVAKSVLISINSRDLEIKPTRAGVILQDGTLQVKAAELSIGVDKDEISRFEVLRVGNSEVKLMPSILIEKLGIEPQEIELKEENAKAVYKIKTVENRKLFGFISVVVEKTSTVDASNLEASVIVEKGPWWAFLTTK